MRRQGSDVPRTILIYVHTHGFHEYVLKELYEVSGVKKAECYDGDALCVASVDEGSDLDAVIKQIRSIRYVDRVEMGG